MFRKHFQLDIGKGEDWPLVTRVHFTMRRIVVFDRCYPVVSDPGNKI